METLAKTGIMGYEDIPTIFYVPDFKNVFLFFLYGQVCYLIYYLTTSRNVSGIFNTLFLAVQSPVLDPLSNQRIISQFNNDMSNMLEGFKADPNKKKE